MKVEIYGGVRMKSKGLVKRVKNPSFWGKHEEKIPLELKEWIFNQYFCKDWLYIYCDSSCSKSNNEMSVACTYVSDGAVIVKNQFINTPKDVHGKNVYGEIKAIIFALLHLFKYLNLSCKGVTIFSDVHNIESLLTNQIVFKNNVSLKRVQKEMINLMNKRKSEYQTLSIQIRYLPLHSKKHNPFWKASHNASRKLFERR